MSYKSGSAPLGCFQILITTLICLISWNNKYVRLVVLNVLLLLDPRLFLSNVASQSLTRGIILEDVHLNWLKWSHFFILAGGLLITLLIFLSLFYVQLKIYMVLTLELVGLPYLWALSHQLFYMLFYFAFFFLELDVLKRLFSLVWRWSINKSK